MLLHYYSTAGSVERSLRAGGAPGGVWCCPFCSPSCPCPSPPVRRPPCVGCALCVVPSPPSPVLHPPAPAAVFANPVLHCPAAAREWARWARVGGLRRADRASVLAIGLARTHGRPAPSQHCTIPALHHPSPAPSQHCTAPTAPRVRPAGALSETEHGGEIACFGGHAGVDTVV